MELLGVVGQVEAHSIRLEVVLISSLDRGTVCTKCTMGLEIFLPHSLDLLGGVIKWKLVSVHLEILLISAQDWCMVCTERAIGLDNILGTPDGTPR
jgi:hypothetical protein